MHLSSFQNTVIPGLRIYDLLSTFMLLLFQILVFYRNYIEAYFQNASQKFPHILLYGEESQSLNIQKPIERDHVEDESGNEIVQVSSSCQRKCLRYGTRGCQRYSCPTDGEREAPSHNYVRVQEYLHRLYLHICIYIHTPIRIHTYLHTHTPNSLQVDCRIAIYKILLRVFLSVLVLTCLPATLGRILCPSLQEFLP